MYLCIYIYMHFISAARWNRMHNSAYEERWGAGVETQKNVRGEVGGWGRVPFNEPYAPSLGTIYDGAQGSLKSWKWYSTPAPHLCAYLQLNTLYAMNI